MAGFVTIVRFEGGRLAEFVPLGVKVEIRYVGEV
jgi:hypothetical protein